MTTIFSWHAVSWIMILRYKHSWNYSPACEAAHMFRHHNLNSALQQSRQSLSSTVMAVSQRKWLWKLRAKRTLWNKQGKMDIHYSSAAFSNAVQERLQIVVLVTRQWTAAFEMLHTVKWNVTYTHHTAIHPSIHPLNLLFKTQPGIVS